MCGRCNVLVQIFDWSTHGANRRYTTVVHVSRDLLIHRLGKVFAVDRDPFGSAPVNVCVFAPASGAIRVVIHSSGRRAGDTEGLIELKALAQKLLRKRFCEFLNEGGEE